MTLRKLKHDDVFELRKWFSEENIASRLSFPDDNWISYVTTKKDVEAYTLTHENGQVVGYLQMDRSDDGEGCIAFAIKPTEQGKGFGSNLLREFMQIIATKLSLLTAFVEPDNAKSISLLKSRGFTTTNIVDEDGMLRFECTIA